MTLDSIRKGFIITRTDEGDLRITDPEDPGNTVVCDPTIEDARATIALLEERA